MFMNTITICNTYMLYDIYIFMDIFSIEVVLPSGKHLRSLIQNAVYYKADKFLHIETLKLYLLVSKDVDEFLGLCVWVEMTFL